MGINTGFELQVDFNEIVRLLGFKDHNIDQDIIDQINEEIDICKAYFKPRITNEKIDIKRILPEAVELSNGVILEGEFIKNKLKFCEYVVVIVSTIGDQIEERIHEAYEEGDFLKAMIIDNIATSALGNLNKIFWNSMIEGLTGSDFGITSRLSPGDTEFNVNEQKKIFKCLEDHGIGVELTDSNMMVPLKSTSAIYGFGKNIGITRLEHVCSECALKNCSYRLKEMLQVKIHYNGSLKNIEAEGGQNLLEVLVKNDIPIDGYCGGNGTCGKCKVRIVTKCTEPNEEERHHLNGEELRSGIRLACKIKILEDIELYIDKLSGKMDVLTEGDIPKFKLRPIVRKQFYSLNKPSLNDQTSYINRIKTAAGNNKLEFDLKLFNKLAEKIQTENYNVTICSYNNHVLQLESGDYSDSNFGVAVDIGTTTVACYLMNCTTGELIDVEAQINTQKKFGADVISRINYTIEDEHGTEKLSKLIRNQINEMLKVLCERNKISNSCIYNMTIAANTTMLHMLLGIQTESIAKAPFIPVFTDMLDIRAEELDIDINGFITLLPSISAYVGSDITSGILSCRMHEDEGYSLLLDLGTNGEIALGNNKQIIACSTAAGPAFEGANIKHGIGGISGAISSVKLDGTLSYRTIQNKTAIGICGSGVLDIVSEMIKNSIIDETGRILDLDEIENQGLKSRIEDAFGIKEFVIEADGYNHTRITFNQRDVREVQLAKAAIAAGIKILLKEAGISVNAIEKVYIGGGFGNYMNIDSAIGIGMLPVELKGKIISVGNCAGSGARLSLLSEIEREKLQSIIRSTKYIELSSNKEFQEYYIDAMMF